MAGDVAGNLNVVAKALRALSLVDLKAVAAKMNNKITTLAIPEGKAKLMRTMFHDVIAMIGTNPAIMLVKEHIVDTTMYEFYFSIPIYIFFNFYLDFYFPFLFGLLFSLFE